MNWISKVLIAFLVLFEAIFLFRFMLVPEPSGAVLKFAGGCQVLMLAAVFCAYRGKLLVTSNVVMLLLMSNLFLVVPHSKLKTLPPSMLRKIEVVGDVMPGFHGVNTISTDERGFRTTQDIDYLDDASTRVFAIGGSTTEQIYVDDHETWTAILERNMSGRFPGGFEVINAGVSGLRAEHHLATLEHIEGFHPDYVVFLVGVNDWVHHVRHLRAGHWGMDRAPFHLGIDNTPLFIGVRMARAAYERAFEDDAAGEVAEVERMAGEDYLSKNNSLAKEEVIEVRFNEVSYQYRHFMEMIAQRCNAGGYRCMFMTQPSSYSHDMTDTLKERLWMTPPREDYTLDLQSLIGISELYNDWLLEFAGRVGVPSCDLASHTTPSEAHFFDDVHFNEAGSAFVAERVTGCFIDHFMN